MASTLHKIASFSVLQACVTKMCILELCIVNVQKKGTYLALICSANIPKGYPTNF